MDRTCVSTAALRKPAVPRRRINRPPRLACLRGGTPPRRGVLCARVLRPAGRHAMEYSLFGIRPATQSTLGRIPRAHRYGRRSNAHHMLLLHRENACRGHERLARAVRAHTREPALPRRQLEQPSTRRKSSSPLERGLDRSPFAPPGQAVVRERTPRSLYEDWLVPSCYA